MDNVKNEGPKLFKKYLQYVEAVSNGDKQEEEVHKALEESGYEVHTQVGVSGYKIDLAVYDCQNLRYVLGIECDGATYHSSKSARERDIHRQRYLESRGWKISRIWSYNWWANPEVEIEKICSRVMEEKFRSGLPDIVQLNR